MADARNVRLPSGFRRYPCPGTDDPIAGTVDVDLGDWIVDKKKEKLHLRVYAEDLPKLIAAIAGAPHREKRFGYGALDVFFVAGKA